MIKLEFTHRINTSNLTRVTNLQIHWTILVNYLLKNGQKIKVTYWPGDLEISDGYSSFGIKALEKLIESKRLLETLDMEEIICPINNDTIDIVLSGSIKANENFVGAITKWFMLGILNEKGETVFYTGDFGSDILITVFDSDITYLSEQGLDTNLLIKQPES